jgi:hypothetical protein
MHAEIGSKNFLSAFFAVLSPNFVAFGEDFRRSVSREDREGSEGKKARDRSFAPFVTFARPLGCGFAALCRCG